MHDDEPPLDATTPHTLETTDDAFLGGRLALLQPRRGYRAGIDAVLLAATVRPAREGERLGVLDLGAGVGTAGLAVAWRLAETDVTMIEREAVLAELARANAQRNALADRVSVVEADVTDQSGYPASLAEARFDRLIANPPFHTTGRGTAAPVGLKARAHEMAEGGLDAWARALARLAAPGAYVAVILPAERVGELIGVLERRFGGLLVWPLHARAHAPALRVIIEARQGSRGPLQILPGAVLHGPGDGFTNWARAVLADGRGIDLAAMASGRDGLPG